MKIGLKLWSVNTDAYLREAKRLYADSVFDYLELYVVPGSEETCDTWKALHDDTGLPFVIHAPHSAHGVNLADATKRKANAKTFGEVRRFADSLSADRIIVHGGFYPYGTLNDSAENAIDELIRQLMALEDPRILVENKPFLPIGNAPIRLVGSTPNEIRTILNGTGLGFCLDIGHAVASANAHGTDWRDWLTDYLSLKPSLFHLSDLEADSKIDQHLHFGEGTLPLREIVSRLPDNPQISIETRHESTTDLTDFQKDSECLKSWS